LPRIRAKLFSKRLRHGIDDPVRINTTSCTDLVNDWAPVDHTSCKQSRVLDFLDQREHGNVDAPESCFDQSLLDWIDLVIGEWHLVELRRIGREEAPGTSCWIRPNLL